MKIFISYPPIESKKGIPLLSQNRQFQWFNNPTYIYPMVPAYAATLLKENNFEVFWDDAIAEEKTYKEWIERVKKNKPDVIAIETKTPVVKRHWDIIKDLKDISSNDWHLTTVLMGDHVTALPEESMQNSSVDFILTGGNYDFLLLNLCNTLREGLLRENSHPGAGQPWTIDHGLSTKLEPGIWYRLNSDIKNTGPFQLNHDLDALPFIDRDLTRWELYNEKNGNYKRLPGTYTMAGRDCWWGRCTFCSWTTTYPGKHYRTRSPQKILDEIGMLIKRYKVKEIFDDSGTFPIGGWLQQFCEGMIKRGYNKKIHIGCNMRLNALKQEDYSLMAMAGFRFILYGLESANQGTLDRLKKNLTVKEIMEGVRMAKKAGLEPHVTVMTGYPWETREDAENTINLVKEMFRKGYIDTLQATIVVPYPGTPMFADAEKNGWIKTKDWGRYDMRESVWESPVGTKDVMKFSQELYKSFLSPQFITRKLLSIRNMDDVKFIWRAGRKLLGHLSDFRHKKEEHC